MKMVSASQVNDVMNLWLSVSASKSKRVLAERLRRHLAKKGRRYKLGTLQNIFSNRQGNTHPALLDGLKDILVAEHFQSRADVERALPAVKPGLYAHVAAKNLAVKCRDILASQPGFTKRKLAQKLARDLAAKGYELSPITLQYILAGRRKVVKKIVVTTLDSYLEKSKTQIKARESALKRLWQRRQSQIDKSPAF